MKLLISACLLGTPCRYDGKSKPLPAETLRRLRERYDLIPVCPEESGGLPTPRAPSERRGVKVISNIGTDVTREYKAGAAYALKRAQEANAEAALLKARSPSCGKGEIYDGTFTKTLIPGNGVTAELLMQNGIVVFTEEDIEKLINWDLSGSLKFAPHPLAPPPGELAWREAT